MLSQLYLNNSLKVTWAKEDNGVYNNTSGERRKESNCQPFVHELISVNNMSVHILQWLDSRFVFQTITFFVPGNQELTCSKINVKNKQVLECLECSYELNKEGILG